MTQMLEGSVLLLETSRVSGFLSGVVNVIPHWNARTVRVSSRYSEVDSFIFSHPQLDPLWGGGVLRPEKDCISSTHFTRTMR